MAARKKLLIVDGYNVLRAGDHYAAQRQRMDDFGDEAYNAAREALINDVAVFAGHEYQALVVFDAADNQYSEGAPEHFGRVEVVFSPAGLSADAVIERRARQATDAGMEVLVVSSDATTQWTVLRDRVSRMSAAGFYNELKMLAAEPPAPGCQAPVKNTLGDRLDPEVLRELRERFG